MIITDHINIPLRSSASVAVIGQFDGVHLSHQRALREAVLVARSMNAIAVAVVMPAPVEAGTEACCLTTADEKMQMLELCGVDVCVLLPSCREGVVSMAELIVPLLKERCLCGNKEMHKSGCAEKYLGGYHNEDYQKD